MKIGLVGYKIKEIKELEKKYSKVQLINIDHKNFFKKKNHDLTALIILYEYPLKNKLNLFIKRKFNLFTKLKWVHFSRAGLNNCIPYINSYKFKLTSGKKIQAPNVSEHCLAMLLFISRNLLSNKNNEIGPIELFGKKILITGFGGIGSMIGKKLNSFGCEIYSSTLVSKSPKFSKKNFKLNKIKKVLNKFDIIINCLPFTKKTKNFFNKNIFKKMKQNSIFVNMSRDETFVLKDLKVFLKNKKILGAGIDSTNIKKTTYIKKLNLLITNHQGGKSDNYLRRKKLIEKNLIFFLKRKKLLNLFSKTKQY